MLKVMIFGIYARPYVYQKSLFMRFDFFKCLIILYMMYSHISPLVICNSFFYLYPCFLLSDAFLFRRFVVAFFSCGGGSVSSQPFNTSCKESRLWLIFLSRFLLLCHGCSHILLVFLAFHYKASVHLFRDEVVLPHETFVLPLQVYVHVQPNRLRVLPNRS